MVRSCLAVLLAAVTVGVASLPASAQVNFGGGRNPSVDDIKRAFGATRSVTPRTETAPAPAPRPAQVVSSDPKQPVPVPAPSVEPAAVVPVPAPAPKPVTVQASGCQIDTGRTVSFDVPFELGSAQLDQRAITTLNNLAQALRASELSACRFLVEGHTDARGSDDLNQVLSYRRAIAVRDYLAANQIDSNRLLPIGKGRTALLNTANPYADENRRVQFRVQN